MMAQTMRVLRLRTGRRALAGAVAALLVLPPGAPGTSQAAAPTHGTNLPAGASKRAEPTRCGWFQNPSPSNATLTDRDGTWVIAAQGGHQADGDWPEFSDSRWVRSGAGSYGHGCGCIAAKADASSHTVLRISRAWSRPLAACRSDRTLTEPRD